MKFLAHGKWSAQISGIFCFLFHQKPRSMKLYQLALNKVTISSQKIFRLMIHIFKYYLDTEVIS